MTAIAFVVAAAVGTLLRVLATSGQTRGEIPWRTFGVNIIGSFVLGIVVTTTWLDNPVAVTVAGLGSFTTFSTVASEAAGLLDDGHKQHAIAYVGLTIVVGIAAAWLGLRIGEASR